MMIAKKTIRGFTKSHQFTRVERKITKVFGALIKFTFLLGFCFVILKPVITMIFNAFMSRADLADNSVLYISRNPTLLNFKAAADTLHYGDALKNTIIITLSTAAIQILSCMMVGYGFARHKFPFKRLLFGIVIFTIIVPPMLFAIPYYRTFCYFDPFGLATLVGEDSINLLNTYFPFWMLGGSCMGIKNGIYIYMFKQAFEALPKELEEAGNMDGASSFGIFWKIMVPNIKSVLVTMILFAVVWQYNDATFTRILFSSEPTFSLSYGNLATISDTVKEIVGYSINDVSVSAYYPVLKSTGAFMMMLPLMIFYAFAQKHFVNSVANAGIVG